MARLKGCDVTVGARTYIASGTFFSSGKKFMLGADTYIGRNVSLSCDLCLGSSVLVASSVAFVGGDHKIDGIDCNIKDAGRDVIKPITVEDNVWVGHGAVILHGVTLNSGCVVAAGSIVTKDVPPNAVVGGNPASLIRFRVGPLN